MNNKQQIIDLVHQEKSTIAYKVIHFPDGHTHFKMKGDINHKYPVMVKCRIRNGEELFLLMQVLDVLNRHGMKPFVRIYYLLAARMDRVMSFSEPFTAKIVLDLLDKYEADFCFYDPHCLRMKYERYDHEKFGYSNPISLFQDPECVCFPDESAQCRFFGASETILYCEKVRDVETGKLSGFQIMNPDDYKQGTITVVDDLCDGGGTFCGIIEELRKLNPDKVALQVTHAIQKQGIERVAALYDEVYITNSYHDWAKEKLPSNVFVTDIIG